MQTITQKSNGKILTIHVRDEADQSVVAEIFKVHEYRIADDIIVGAQFPILDVGAHAGFFTLYARTLNATVPIVAVEPEPANVQLLNQHLDENKVKNVAVVPAALGRESGAQRLMVTTDSHNHRLMAKNESAKVENVITVNVYSFKDLCKKFKLTKISLIKMDIEGGEYDVFAGMEATDWANVGAVILEYHTVNNKKYSVLEAQLREAGFGVQIFPSKFDKTMGFLFARNKKSAIL